MRAPLTLFAAGVAVLVAAWPADARPLETTTKICMRLLDERDFVRGLRHCHTAAEAGVADAQYALAAMYYAGLDTYGMGRVQYADLAYHYASQAAQQDHPLGMLYMAYMYEQGIHVDADPAIAAEWYERAAEAGVKGAQRKLGVAYANGLGVERDTEKALHWYRKAIEQGSGYAAINVGLMYERGQGVDQDDVEAARYYQIAIDAGLERANSCLGYLHLIGAGVDQDVDKAFKLIRKGAKVDDAFGQSTLGALYLEGTGTRASEKKAMKSFAQAAANGNRRSAFELAILYRRHDGKWMIPPLSYAWLIVADETGDGRAATHRAGLEAAMAEEQLALGQTIAAAMLGALR